MKPELELYLHAEDTWVDEAYLEHCRQALVALMPELLACPPGPDHVLSQLDAVEISIVDDPAIARVHADYLNDPTPTDAITFLYGEILVSCDTAARYAAEHKLEKEEELFRYIVHGLTHLHGYLDYEPADREALFAIQEPLVARHCPFGKGCEADKG